MDNSDTSLSLTLRRVPDCRQNHLLSLTLTPSLTHLLTYYLSRPTNFNIRVEHVREMRFPSATT